MSVTFEWWKANCIRAHVFEEGKVKIDGRYLTTVAYVKIVPPPGRENVRCYIHGDVSFNVGRSGEPVTHYSRKRDNPELIDLSDESACYLALTDGHDGERPLGEISASNMLYINMKLYEKNGSEDVLIANLKDFEHYDRDTNWDLCCYCSVKGEAGFKFEVCYTVVFGARAEVVIKIHDELRMKKGGEGEGEGEGCSDRKIPMWGSIEAYQYLQRFPHGWDEGVSSTTLLNLYDNEEMICKIDKPIKLERKFVVAPMLYGKFLSIGLDVVTDHETPGIDNDGILHHEVDFPLGMISLDSFVTNKDLTHTKLIDHVEGTVFSVSLKFVHPEEVISLTDLISILQEEENISNI